MFVWLSLSSACERAELFVPQAFFTLDRAGALFGAKVRVFQENAWAVNLR
jgi:hypothetical protein